MSSDMDKWRLSQPRTQNVMGVVCKLCSARIFEGKARSLYELHGTDPPYLACGLSKRDEYELEVAVNKHIEECPAYIPPLDGEDVDEYFSRSNAHAEEWRRKHKDCIPPFHPHHDPRGDQQYHCFGGSDEQANWCE